MISINSIAKAHEYLQLGKPIHPLLSVIDYLNKDIPHIQTEGRFLVNLYNISLKANISGNLGYGRSSYDFSEGSMIFTAPGQVVESNNSEDESENRGWTILFHPDLIRKSNLGKTIQEYSFFDYSLNEALHLSEKEMLALKELVAKIDFELNQNLDRHSHELIIHNLESILKYCNRYYDRQFYTRTIINKDIVIRFEQFIKNYFASNELAETGIPSINQCGQALNMSGHYLSDMLRAETGKSAKEHITMAIVDRAKTNLLNSNESVSKIAYDLGFNYPNHFSKLFKAQTGMSPSQYRRVN